MVREHQNPEELVRIGDTLHVDMPGFADVEDVPAFEEAIDQMIADEALSRIVIDLSKIQLMDSTGLRTLVRAHQRSTEAEKPLILSNPSKACQRVLEVSGLVSMFVVEAPEPDQSH